MEGSLTSESSPEISLEAIESSLSREASWIEGEIEITEKTAEKEASTVLTEMAVENAVMNEEE